MFLICMFKEYNLVNLCIAYCACKFDYILFWWLSFLIGILNCQTGISHVFSSFQVCMDKFLGLHNFLMAYSELLFR